MISPFGPTLYRRIVFAVIYSAGVWSGCDQAQGQFAKKTSASKGPRAVGILEIEPRGTARLVPVCIMVDGKFFDAGAYKAAPVPMALEGGTVYEGMRTGTSTGLFTVTGVRQRKQSWVAEGSWVPSGSRPPPVALKAESQPREDEDKPPTLRHGAPSPHSPEPPDLASRKPTVPAEASRATDRSAASSPPAQPSPPDSSDSPVPDDPDRPRLRRGVPARSRTDAVPAAQVVSGASLPAASHTIASAPPAELRILPAVSDADGPEPRPYAYQMKPEEETEFRRKMLSLAATEVSRHIEGAAAGTSPITPSSPEGTRASRPRSSTSPKVVFEDQKLRVFDVATNNEPILVLTAHVRLPQKVSPGDGSPIYYLAIVAHSDLYGELHKLLSAVTDDRHLDVVPRMDLIDAVDADGDSRAELLFRQTFDSGVAFAVYRVGADQLWPLFQGTPTQ